MYLAAKLAAVVSDRQGTAASVVILLLHDDGGKRDSRAPSPYSALQRRGMEILRRLSRGGSVREQRDQLPMAVLLTRKTTAAFRPFSHEVLLDVKSAGGCSSPLDIAKTSTIPLPDHSGSFPGLLLPTTYDTPCGSEWDGPLQIIAYLESGGAA